jgi:hypothetical protein
LYLFIGFSTTESEHQARAQLVLIFLPVQQQAKITHPNLEPGKPDNRTSSPTIQVLTSSLIEGKSVFNVRITDKSHILNAKIMSIQNGKIVPQDLVRQPNNIYNILVDAHLPSKVIVTNAVDLDGKTSSVVSVLNVTPLPNSIFDRITNFLFDVGKSIVSVFRSTN